MRRLLLLTLLLLSAAACTGPVVRKQVLLPAPAAEAAKLRKLTVAGFDNDHDGQVRAATEQALAAVTLSGRPYFLITGVQTAAQSQSQGVPLLWTEPGKSAAKPLPPQEGVVSGRVEQNSWRDEEHPVFRTECLVYDDKGRCLRQIRHMVTCVRRTAVFRFAPVISRKGTGEVVAAEEFSQTEQDNACLDERGVTPGRTLLSRARSAVLTRFAQYVAPHYVSVEIPLLLEDESGLGAGVKAELASGADYAKAGRTDKACQLWRHAAQTQAGGYALPYLQGVCAELEDNLALARDYYSQADANTHKPVPEIGAALERIQKARADREALAGQLR